MATPYETGDASAARDFAARVRAGMARINVPVA
jgi:hypothetical protein